MRQLSLFGLLLVATVRAQSSSIPSSSSVSTITRGASITLKIDDFEKLRKDLIKESSKFGGVLADSKLNVSPKGRKHGWFRVSVPAMKFEEAMAAIRASGVLVGEQSSTRNRDPEIKELDIRRASVGSHVDRLLQLSQSGKRMRASDQLYYQDLIFRAEADRDLLLHEKHKIESNVENASIIVSAYEKGEDITAPPSGWSKFWGTVVRSGKDTVMGTASSIVDWTLSLIKLGVALLVGLPLWRQFSPALKRGWGKLIGAEQTKSAT